MAGITVLPARSIRVVPAGAAISPLRPIRVMVPRSTRMAELSSAALRAPAIKGAPWNSTVCAVAGCATVAAASAARPNQAAVRWNIGISPFALPQCLVLGVDRYFAPCPAACQSTELFALYVQLAHHAGVLVVLTAHVGSKIRTAMRVRIERLKCKPGLALRRLDRAAKRVHELRHRGRRRFRRCHQAKPSIDVEPRIA